MNVRENHADKDEKPNAESTGIDEKLVDGCHI